MLLTGCMDIAPDRYEPVTRHVRSIADYRENRDDVAAGTPQATTTKNAAEAGESRTDRGDDEPPPTPRVLTIEDARAIALGDNPDIHAAIARLDAARSRIEEAASVFYPNVVLTHNSARTFLTPASRNRLNTLLQPTPVVPTNLDAAENFAVTALLNAIRTPLLGSSEPGGLGRSFSEHSTSLTITWSIFDGFARDARLLSARYLRDASSYGLDDARRLLIHAVDTAYFQVQLAQERIRIALADEEFSRQQLEVTRKLLDADRASQADVENFEVRMLGAQSAVTAAKGLRDSGRVILGELLGIEDAALPEELALSPLMEETPAEMATPPADAWIAHALRNRPDYIRSHALLASQRQVVRANRSAYSPSVGLSGSWGYDHSSNFRYSKDDQSAAAAVELRWELFTGGGRRARIEQAHYREAEAEATVQRIRLAVQSETRQAIIDLNDAQQQIHLRDETLRTALAARRRVEAAYLAGRENLTRLNEAQRDVITADADLALARIRLRQAWSDLAAAAATYGETAPDPPDERDPG